MVEILQSEIMENWGEFNHPLVSIECLAFNQENYIEQALDGFISQITNFPFEIFIHDDASTDMTANIIKKYELKYPLIVKPIYSKENLYSKHNGSLTPIITENTKGDYIALCDGDDYWIDRYKLQKQIDFMKSNTECGLCYTNFNILYESKNEIKKDALTKFRNQYPSEFTLEQWVLSPGYVGPMTWIYKKSLYVSIERMGSKDFSFELFAYALATSKVGCLINDTTAVYRIGHESAVHTSDPCKYYKRVKSLMQVRIRMIKKYGLPPELQEKILTAYYNKAFHLIGLNNDIEERIKAKKYCHKLRQRLYLTLTQIPLIRKIIVDYYKYKHKD